MPRKIDFPPIPGTENEQWDELATEFGMERDEIKKIVFPSWMFDKGFINKWDVRKMLINKGYKQIIQSEEDDPEDAYNEWLKEHPFTKKWHEACPYFNENPHYEKPNKAETINEGEIKIEDMEPIFTADDIRRTNEKMINEGRANNVMKEYEKEILQKKIKEELDSGKLTEIEEDVVRKWLNGPDFDIHRQVEDGVKKQYVKPECGYVGINPEYEPEQKNMVEKIEPNSFDGICFDLMDLHRRKNKDYGNAADASYREFGIVSYVIRLNDKLNRLKSLTKPGATMEVKDESIIDTFKDLAAYSIMAIESLLNDE